MRVTLYTRAGCHLCEEAKAVLSAARRRAAFDLDEIDIDGDSELRRLYDQEVPVVAIDGTKAFKYRLTVEEFLKKLRARS
ncbi:MAG: glutaredoxin family protein [Bryobacteraceae bacterium]